jgi:hypothetical protein
MDSRPLALRATDALLVLDVLDVSDALEVRNVRALRYFSTKWHRRLPAAA